MNPPTIVETHTRNGSSAGTFPAVAKPSALSARAIPLLLDALPADHRGVDLQKPSVGGQPLPSGQWRSGTHTSIAVGELLDPLGFNVRPAPITPSTGWVELRVLAEVFTDAQQLRIATENRVRELGGVFAERIAEPFRTSEHAARLELRRTYRRVVPAEILEWQKAERGVGADLLARLLGHLGDPYIATPHAWMVEAPDGHGCDLLRCGKGRHLVAFEPFTRTVSQLWSYCGHGDSARRKFKGMTADDALALGSPTCKMLVHLLAESCMKQPSGNRYRDFYEARRLVTADRVHAVACVRCGPSGRPAAEGSLWSKAHQHADALRIVGKELLRDLWLVRHAAAQSAAELQRRHGDGVELAKETA